MSAKLITGNLFSPITASEDSDYQGGLSGNKTRILPIGSQMDLSIVDANTISCADGVLVTKEGRRIQIDNGAVEQFTIPTGTQGQTKYYVFGFHLYTTDEAGEECEPFTEEVSSATGTLPETTFRSGATEVYICIGRISQVGVNLGTLEKLIPVASSIVELEETVAQLSQHLTDIERSGIMPILDYAHPITTLTDSYYTTTQECYAVGNLVCPFNDNSQLIVDGTTVFNAQYQGGSAGMSSSVTVFLKIASGSQVKVNRANGCYVNLYSVVTS